MDVTGAIQRLDHEVGRLGLLALGRYTIYQDTAQQALPRLPADSVRTIVTSPPYWNKRQYDIAPSLWDDDPICRHDFVTAERPGVSGGTNSSKLATKGTINFQLLPAEQQLQCRTCPAWVGQLGREPDPQRFVRHLGDIFELCKRALTADGTLWVVLDDSWAGSGMGPSGHNSASSTPQQKRQGFTGRIALPPGCKRKDLVGVPWMLAEEMRLRGWYWRSTIIWVKPNGLPFSGSDRPGHFWEPVLLFSQSEHYFYHPLNQMEPSVEGGVRQMRDVWIIPPEPTDFEHFAAFPEALAARCISLGSQIGDTVLDPFMGIGRTGRAALRLRRSFVGIEPGVKYATYAEQEVLPHVQQEVRAALASGGPRIRS